MLSQEEARVIALALIAQLTAGSRHKFVILEKGILERSFAWAFPFNTQEFAETGDFEQMAIGLGPVVVNRRSGAAEVAPSGRPIARFLEDYEAGLNGPR